MTLICIEYIPRIKHGVILEITRCYRWGNVLFILYTVFIIYIHAVIFNAKTVSLRNDLLQFHSSEQLSFDCELEIVLIFEYGKAMEKCLFMN